MRAALASWSSSHQALNQLFLSHHRVNGPENVPFDDRDNDDDDNGNDDDDDDDEDEDEDEDDDDDDNDDGDDDAQC